MVSSDDTGQNDPSHHDEHRVTPISMTSPSRVVNFDRLMPLPPIEGFKKKGSTVLIVPPSLLGGAFLA
jgi:hypothetical protein